MTEYLLTLAGSSRVTDAGVTAAAGTEFQSGN